MKNIIELIKEYSIQGIELYLDNGQLYYNAPKDIITDKHIAQLKSNKEDIIAYLEGDSDQKCLSFSQEQLWILNQYKDIGSAYNMMSVFHMNGPLDLSILLKSVATIIKRHNVLRTNYGKVDGVPNIELKEETTFPIEFKDFSKMEEDFKINRAKEWLNSYTQQPFDLEMKPLINLAIGVLAQEEFVLGISMHHLISDGWSMDLFFEELSEIYNSEISGKSPVLPELPFSFSKYASSQRLNFKNGKFNESINYWVKKLKSSPQLISLPYDKNRPISQTFVGQTNRVKIDRTIHKSLEAFAKENNMSLYMVLLSLYAIVLSHFSSQKDIVIGTPTSGRLDEKVSNLIGYFVNTIPLRVKLDGVSNFKQLFSLIKDEVIESLSNQEVPFKVIVDSVKPQRNKSYSPIVQTLFVLQNNDEAKPKLNNIESEKWDIDINSSKMDLSLMITECEDGLVCEWEYNTDLFNSCTITTFSEAFECLCSLISCHTSEELFNLDFNNINLPVIENKPEEKTIHSIFESHVKNEPDAIALYFNNSKMTYYELNEKAEKLKDYLISIGIRKNQPVGLYLDKSFEMIIALLGILKAGGCYVPIDTNSPQERIDYIIKDSQIGVLLSTTSMKNELPDFNGVIFMDKEYDPNISINCKTIDSNKDLAYIIYTSGSTGEPKGAIIPHSGVRRLVINPSYMNISKEDVFYQNASIAFDAATFEIWGALLNGGALVIPTSGLHTLKEIGEVIVNKKVTVLLLTTGLFHIFVDTQIKYLKNLKYLLAGGDVLSVEHVNKVLKTLNNTIMINVYGPTEDTTFATCHPMLPGTVLKSSVPIGEAISETDIYIVDEDFNQILDKNIPGELYLGGNGVAIGYIGKPELTAERFIENPFDSNYKGKLYKTGDLVKLLPDGNLDFVGRVDNQVKLRGYRIELEEIESTLLKIDNVSEAVVLCSGDVSGNKKLVAYLVLRPEFKKNFNEEVINKQLQKWLPEYMVPSEYTVLDKFPLNLSGKVDRKALMPPEKNIEIKGQSEVNNELLAIIRNTLENDSIGMESNIFDIGGNSLSIIRLISEIEAQFNVSLDITDFMELPSISVLVEKIMEESDNFSLEVELLEQDNIEEDLLNLISEILEISNLSMEDNIFDLGGDSLSMIRIIAEVDSKFDVTLDISDLLDLPDLASIAGKIINEKVVTKDENIINEEPEIEEDINKNYDENDVEASLISIIEDVLELKNINLQDNFFELGGHSFSILRIISGIDEVFNVSLSVTDFLETPVLSELVKKVEDLKNGKEIVTEASLSTMQKQLYFMDQLPDVGTSYNIASVLELTGKIDIEKIKFGLDCIMERHESLRTIFKLNSGIPYQKILDLKKAPFNYIDISHMPLEVKQKHLDEIIKKETFQKFDLSQFPLWKVTLVKLTESKSYFILDLHHIISDGWSMGIFFDELSKFYNNNENELPVPLKKQYRHFVDSQNEYLNSNELEKSTEYWKEKFKDASTILSLPVDNARPARQTFTGNTIYFEMPENTIEKLNLLNKQCNSMMFITLFAMFNIFISKWSNVKDLTIGTPIANRNKKDLSDLIGYFVNILPIRSQLETDVTFIDFMEQIKINISEAIKYQETPLDKLIEVINPERNPSFPTLFQVMFHYYSGSSDTLNIPEIKSKEIEIFNLTSKFDFMLTFSEKENQLVADWEYNTDLFSDSTINQLTKSFLGMINQIISNPEIRISDLLITFPKSKNESISIGEVTQKIVSNSDLKNTYIEEEVISIVKDVLDIPYVEKHKSFFELGGHSLMVLKFIEIINEKFNIELSVMEISSNPVIKDLAIYLENLVTVRS